MKRWLIAAIVVEALISLPAKAEIFKCVGSQGRVTFQDSPCLGSAGTTINIRPSGSGVVVVQPRSPPKAAATKSPESDDDDGKQAAAAKPLTPAQREATQLKAMENDRKRRAIDHDLGEAESRLESVKASMEQDLASLRARKETLTGSVPGSPLEQNVSNELQIATDRYQNQMRTAEDRVSELRNAREELAGSAARSGSGRQAAGGGKR